MEFALMYFALIYFLKNKKISKQKIMCHSNVSLYLTIFLSARNGDFVKVKFS